MPTSRDVAEAVGVSQATVSRAFSAGSVAPALRDRILKKAAEMGYRPNALARSLTVGRSHLVAVLVSPHVGLVYPELVYGLTDELEALGYRMILFSALPDRALAGIVDEMLGHHVDGIISTLALDAEAARIVERSRVPLVYFNQAGSAAKSSVFCDHFEGGRVMAGRLLAAGHRRFGLIVGQRGSFVGDELRRGLEEGLEGSGARLWVEPCEYRYDRAAAAMAGIAEQAGGVPDALVSLNDTVAAGCIDHARHHLGLRIPEDLSVVGFNGRGPLLWDAYRLTGMTQPIEQMTRGAVRMLDGEIRLG
jgi:DNA-binding LacI/PurR family transcriptional regulator